jgi:hypothetical protein
MDASKMTGTNGANVPLAGANLAGTNIAVSVATASGATTSPTLNVKGVNDLNSMNFDGTMGLSLSNVSTLPLTTTSTTFVVASVPSSQLLPQMLLQYGGTVSNSGVNTRQLYIANSDRFIFADIQLASGSTARTDDNVLTSTPFVASAIHATVDGGTNFSNRGWRNGTPFSNVGTNGAMASVSTGTVGSIGFGFSGTTVTWRLIGQICEMLVFEGELTSSLRQQMEGYLAWKWGSSPATPASRDITLPTTHPYYSTRP